MNVTGNNSSLKENMFIQIRLILIDFMGFQCAYSPLPCFICPIDWDDQAGPGAPLRYGLYET